MARAIPSLDTVVVLLSTRLSARLLPLLHAEMRNAADTSVVAMIDRLSLVAVGVILPGKNI